MARTKVKTNNLLSHRQLVWRAFKKHKIAVAGGIVLICYYTVALFCEFLAPYDPRHTFPDRELAPPQRLHFVDSEGHFSLRPFAYDLTQELNTQTWLYGYEKVEENRYPFRLFVRGDEYKMWGFIRTNVHLFGVDGGTIFLFGTDKLGRDMLSRTIYGTRVSLTIGLLGVFISLILGLLFGGLSGMLGGTTDVVIQRIIEVLLCIPAIPLWMALSAALPHDWSPLTIFFALTVVLSLIGWTPLARVVRGKILSLREEEFVLAARVSSLSTWSIIRTHMIPNFFSYVLVNVTLAIPGMILGETALSFLGIGLRPPINSWGVLLQQAQSFQTVAIYPWLLIPGFFVIVAVLSLNFVGDGLRDAVDPYSSR